MNLYNHLKKMSKKEAAAFAERCGTSYGYLYQVALGNRSPSPYLAIEIERESGGVIRCEVLCPHADWAYIRSSQKTNQQRKGA